MVKRILISGAAGFVGSHFVEDVIQNTDWEIVALVRLGTVGDVARITSSLHNLAPGNAERIQIVWHDLRSPINPTVDARIGHIDYVCHLAANSHVDRSITHPREFFEDNVMGTVNLLEWARLRNYFWTEYKGESIDFYDTGVNGPIQKFLNFNTDEVFGPAPPGYDYKEDDRWRPSNPYSGSKAGQAAAGFCYFKTYGLPVITTHMMNIFGERQKAEKLFPKSIKYIIEGKPMPVFAELDNGVLKGVGERHWLHARNAANATLFILQNGTPGEFYNIVGDTELTNEEIVRKVGEAIGKEPIIEYVDFHKTRPGHDRRYALCGNKLREMGWVPPVSFDDSVKSTVEWYLANPEWLK